MGKFNIGDSVKFIGLKHPILWGQCGVIVAIDCNGCIRTRWNDGVVRIVDDSLLEVLS